MRNGILVIGLTGQTGAGKSTAREYLQSLGIDVIDADLVSRLVTQKGSEALNQIQKEFSSKVLSENSVTSS